MRLSTLLFLLTLSSQLTAQGWIWESGTAARNEALQLVWADTDSTVVCVGDSAGRIAWKQFNHQGQLLASKQVGTITNNGSIPDFTKKDFGFTFLSRFSDQISWTAFHSYSYYQLTDDAGNPFNGGLVNGQNNNDYAIYDATLTPDSAVLAVGVHLNPDENKLYLISTLCCNQPFGNWIKEVHDSTGNIVGLRIFAVAGNRFAVLARRNGKIGNTPISETGFLLLNATGDVLESNWIPNSGAASNNPNLDIPLERDADGFSLLLADKLYRFDALGHLLWTKQTGISFVPLGLRRTNSGYIICGYEPVYWGENAGMAKLDQAGNLIWNRIYDFREKERWHDVVPLAEGGYIAVGSISNPTTTYNSDYFAAKINADGSIFRNTVVGYAFADNNGNCLREPNEPGISGLNISFDNSYFPNTLLTDPAGKFDILSDTGAYVLKVSPPPGAYWAACLDSLTGYFNAFNTIDTLYVPFQPTTQCPEMRIDLEANRIRPCSTALVYLRWQNVGTAPADSVSITLTVPPNAQLTDAQLPAIDLGGGQYRFNIGPVAMGASGQASVTITGDCDLQIGDFLCLQARIFPDSICATPEPLDPAIFQFAQERCLEVRNSLDPNDKSAEPAGRGEEFHYIPDSTVLTYLIRFQNTGNDTAFTVVIRDTLSAHLYPFSVQPEIASHSYRLEFQEDGSLKFVFDHILLPDSATNEAASQGFIRFKVRLRPGLLPFTPILNRAAIYFDYNPPVLTNAVLRTIESIVSGSSSPDNHLPLLEISPNPTHLAFTLRMLLERATDVRVSVYDITGKWVSQVQPARHLMAGAYSFLIPADNWPPGIYFLEIQTDGQKTVRKMVKQ